MLNVREIKDPTVSEHHAPLGYKVITSLKKLNAKRVKFYGMGKRRLYWEVWERESGRYESYQDFKGSWDPNRKFFKSIVTDAKDTFKKGKRFGVLDNSRHIKGSTSREVHDLLRRKRPFNK